MEEDEGEAHSVIITNDFWPRWSEKSINEIQWGLEEIKKKTPKKSPKPVASEIKESTLFIDKDVCILPKKYQEIIYCWKRPNEIFEPSTPEDAEKTKIDIFSNSDIDLHEFNTHLKLSSYYLEVIDSFEALKWYKTWTKDDFKEFGFMKWSPLNHIYSGMKVQQGVPHQVQVNPYGKYVIRLFHCGTWRQIIIDDRIPTDKRNQILLPCIRTATTLELWPILITKAILKLNFCRMEDEEFYLDQRHTPECKMYDGDYCNCKVFIPNKPEYIHEEKNLQRINVIYALTGWCPLERNFSGKYASDVWESVSVILEHYKIPLKQIEDKSKKKGTKGVGPGKKDKKTEIVSQHVVEVPPVLLSLHSLVTIDIALPPNLIEKNYKRNFMELLCYQYRDTPLFEMHHQEEIPLWKTFRWVYWAMEKNIWKPYDPSVYWSLLCSLPRSKKTSFEKILEDEWAGNVLKKDVKEEINDITVQKGIKDKQDKKKGKEKEKKQTKVVKRNEPFPIDNWLSFNKILPFLQCIKEYFKYHEFEKTFTVTDEKIIQEIPIVSKKKKDKDTLKSPGSKASKKTTKDQKIDELLEEKFNFSIEKSEILYLFIDDDKESEIIMDLSVTKLCPEKSSAVTLSSFRWYCEKQKQILALLTTNFTNIKMRLPKGRNVYMLEFDASKFYLRIYTNAPLKMGYFDDLLKMMDSESVRIIKYFENIKKTFLEVINSIGKKQFPINVQNFFHSLLQYCIEFYRDIGHIRRYIYYKFLEHIFQFLTILDDYSNVLNLKRLFILADFSHSYDPELNFPDNMKQFLKNYNDIKDCLCDCPNQEEPYYTEEELHRIREYAAVKIQAAMKRYYVKLLKVYHFGTKQKPQEKPNILKAALLRFYEKYFEKEPDLMYDLLRKFFFTNFENFQHNDILESPIPAEYLVGKLYEFFNDFKNSMRLLKYQGIVEQGNHWIPLKIGCFYCHSSDPTKYILNFSSSLRQKVEMFVKVIKCDDFTEVSPTVEPYLFTLTKGDKSGYKVGIYIYSLESIENLNWSLQVSFPRHISYGHFCDLCGIDKCHCPSDVKISQNLENYAIKCESVEMQDFVVFQNDGILYENDARIVCQFQILSGERNLIFGFVQYSGEPALNLIVTVIKEESVRPLIERKFTDKTDFCTALDVSSYTITVSYEKESRLKKFLDLQKISSSLKEDIDIADIEGNEMNEENVIEEVEEEPKELGIWEIKIAYEVGMDIIIN